MTLLVHMWPMIILGVIALWFGIKGRVRLFLYFVPLSLVAMGGVIWAGLGFAPTQVLALMLLLSLGLFLSACFWLGWLVRRLRGHADQSA